MTTKHKMKASLCKRLLVAAIDLGTTYSGYAFSLTEEPFNLKYRSMWNGRSCGLYLIKEPTILLLDENKKFVAFGYEAEDLYEQYVNDGTHGNYYYFRKFKTSLHTSVKYLQIMDINCKIKDVNGKEVEALIVLTESIKYLKTKAEFLTEIRGYSIVSDDVEWVIIVPAMWTDAGKQFMRKAAEKAGIKDEILKIVLEPEAASVFYMHMNFLPTDRRSNKIKNDERLKCDSKNLVVVLGDHTVDLALHQGVDETSFRELVPPCRGHFTGTTAVENYVKLLEGIVGKDIFKSFAEENKDDLLDLHTDFDARKRTFDYNCNDFQNNTHTQTTLRIPGTLIAKMKEMYPTKVIDNVIEQDEKLRCKVTWIRDKLRINVDLFASFFKTHIEWIMNEMEGFLRNAADVEAILLFGDCAESPVIHKSVKSRFSNKIVIVPEDTGFSVLKGAVIYGHFPNTIVSRVARHSYGIRVYRDFIPGQHPQEKLVVIGTKRKCKDVFAVHVKKGQDLRVGEVQSSQRYTRLERDQKSLIFDFFISTSENPEYVTDDGCEELGQLEVELESRSMSVSVWLKYGETELEAECFDEVTGQKTKATFKFLKE